MRCCYCASIADSDEKLVTNRWSIAYTYCTSWLIIDLLAVIPFDLLPSGDEFTELEGVQLAKVRSLSLPAV
jgi:hypothetical protein